MNSVFERDIVVFVGYEVCYKLSIGETMHKGLGLKGLGSGFLLL